MKIQSIRFKLLIYMMISVLIFSAIILLANTFLVEKYYLNHKKKAIINTVSEINQILNIPLEEISESNKKEAFSSLFRLERKNSQSIYIESENDLPIFPPVEILRIFTNSDESFTTETKIAFSEVVLEPKREIADFRFRINAPHEFAALNKRAEKLNEVMIISQEDENSFFLISQDPGLNLKMLTYKTKTADNLNLTISMPMNAIADNITILNQIILYICIFYVAVIIMWSWYASKSFTKPITKLNRIAGKMKDLDFSEIVEIKGEDEISELSESINSLSNALSKTINELSEKNEQLAKDIEKERKIDKMRREFISNVSHELKTPIFLIQGYSDGLKIHVKEEKKREFYCDVITEETEKMDLMVKDLLEIAKLESDETKLSKSIFNINLLLSSVTKKYKQAENLKTITFIVELEKEKTFVDADIIKIEQVITNFINNATEHVDEKKIIKIISKKMSDEVIRISVYNSGANISEEVREQLWISFYKVDKARTRSLGGTGLGLSIVKAILDAHESKFSVENTSDGVNFWFELEIIKRT